jgi:hypothetical protein
MKSEAALIKAGFKQHRNFWHWYKDIDGERLDYWPNTDRAQFMGQVFWIERMAKFLSLVENKPMEQKKIVIEHWPAMNEIKRQLKAAPIKEMNDE